MTQKEFKIAGDQIKRLIPNMGGAFATDHILIEGKKVGYMYREESSDQVDSGWRFFSGEENQEYVDDPENTAIYEVNTIVNYDPAIIPYLESKEPCAFERILGTDNFQSVEQ